MVFVASFSALPSLRRCRLQLRRRHLHHALRHAQVFSHWLKPLWPLHVWHMGHDCRVSFIGAACCVIVHSQLVAALLPCKHSFPFSLFPFLLFAIFPFFPFCHFSIFPFSIFPFSSLWALHRGNGLSTEGIGSPQGIEPLHRA